MMSSTAMSRARSGALTCAACVAVAVLVPAPALAATPARPSTAPAPATALAPADAAGGPGGGDSGGTDGSPTGPQPPFGGGGGSAGGSTSGGTTGDPSDPSDSGNGTAGGVPHPLPGNHGGGGGTTAPASSNAGGDSGGGVVTQVSDFVQNLFKSLGSLFGNAHAATSSGSGSPAASSDDKPSKVNEARANDQAGSASDVDRLAAGGSNSDRRARRQGHSQPTVDDVVFSVQAGVSRVIGSVVRH